MRFLRALLTTACAALSLSGANVAAQDAPQQIHISYSGTGLSGMTVSWSTQTQDAASFCQYGTTSGGPYTLNATGPQSTTYDCGSDYTSPYQHHVPLTGLTPNTKYYYVCGDSTNGLSQEASFTSATAVNGASSPFVLAIIGDLGQTDDSNSTITNLVNNGAFNHVFIVGDLSYADGDGTRWDSWGALVQPLTQSWAFMSTTGNHEEEASCGTDFLGYLNRMAMPYQESGSTNPLWYSYETGPLHIISFASYADYDSSSDQYAWIQQDLAKIDRTKTPWVIGMQHVPWYNSNHHHQGEGDDIAGTYEQIYHTAGIDMVFSGHVHAYERSKKVFNQTEDPKGIVHITIGDGGNREGLAEPWNDPQPDWSAYRQAAFGYGMLTIPNATHALWEWHRDEDGLKVITDSVWVVKGQTTVIENPRPVTMPIAGWKNGVNVGEMW